MAMRMEIDPVHPTDPTRRARIVRRMRLRDADKGNQNALVPVGPVEDHDAEPHREVYTPLLASFSAQLLSTAEPRGLKGGQILRKSAKAAYLNTEYSGPHERRNTAGENGERDI
jgi:hypothetical protein